MIIEKITKAENFVDVRENLKFDSFINSEPIKIF
jgi:hypothetical protein